MSATAAPSQASRTNRRSGLRSLLVWMLSFLSIPIAGYLGTFVVGRVDNLGSALLGGALVGAIVGSAQAFASRGRLRKVAWPLATAIGMSAGVALGTLAVGYRTGLGDLVVVGLITGVAVGVAQAIALPAGALRWLWLPISAALWPLAWTITTLSGIKVDEQFIIFGASGAVVYTVLAGFALQVLVKTPVTSKAVSTPELIAH